MENVIVNDISNISVDNGLKYRFVLKYGIHTHLLAFPMD